MVTFRELFYSKGDLIRCGTVEKDQWLYQCPGSLLRLKTVVTFLDFYIKRTLRGQKRFLYDSGYVICHRKTQAQ